MSTCKLVEAQNGRLQACQIFYEGIGTILVTFAHQGSGSGYMLGVATVGYPENKDMRVYFDIDKIRFIRDALTRMIDEAARDES